MSRLIITGTMIAWIFPDTLKTAIRKYQCANGHHEWSLNDGNQCLHCPAHHCANDEIGATRDDG